LKVRGVQREGGKKKNHILGVGKLIFLLAIFSLLHFICTSKMISKAHPLLNETRWFFKGIDKHGPEGSLIPRPSNTRNRRPLRKSKKEPSPPPPFRTLWYLPHKTPAQKWAGPDREREKSLSIMSAHSTAAAVACILPLRLLVSCPAPSLSRRLQEISCYVSRLLHSAKSR
jgi:hypothetical protein